MLVWKFYLPFSQSILDYFMMASHLVHHVTDRDDFDTQIKEAGSKLVIVDFYAQWCGPCKLLSPELDKFSKMYTDVIFMKVDIDELEELAADFDISGMPTIIGFLEENQIGTIVGANGEKLQNFILKHKK